MKHKTLNSDKKSSEEPVGGARSLSVEIACDLSEPRYITESSWLDHGPFALWLVENLQPRTIVELGTHKGFSYFCFCQAVEENRLSTQCFAVDTWQGDEHAGQYDDDVFRSVRLANRPYESFSTLLRMRFDEALAHFDDGSVDLLHVDGRHFYEDVKEDFESWLPKLSSRAIVLFHDTEVRERGFGVYRYWMELAQKWPAFNFFHGNGLGILFFGKEFPSDIRKFIQAVSYPAGAALVRTAFEVRGRAVGKKKLSQQSSDRISELNEELAVLTKQLKRVRLRPLSEVARLGAFRTLSLINRRSRLLPRNLVEASRRRASELDPRRTGQTDRTKTFWGSDFDHEQEQRYEKLVRFWMLEQHLSKRELDRNARELEAGTKVSILLPLTSAEVESLKRTIGSINGQRFRNWEVLIAAEGSIPDQLRSTIEQLVVADRRIKSEFLQGRASRGALFNASLQLASGQYVLPLQPGDLLERDALLNLVEAAREKHKPRIVYSDEDQIDLGGHRTKPHFKPDWNRDLLYAWNYIDRPVMCETELARSVGGYREKYDAAAEYDFLLRCVAECDEREIRHIPRVLLHRNTVRAEDDAILDDAWNAGLAALSEHLSKQAGREIPVVKGLVAGSYAPKWPLPATLPLVSLIIPTRDRLDLLKVAVGSILLRTDYPNFEILIVDNGSVTGETIAWLQTIVKEDARVRVIRDDRPFNFSALNNAAVAQARGEIIGLVNNDVEVLSRGWLGEMVSLAIRPDTGCVGAKLYYPDGRIQHAGVIVGLGGVAGHSHKFYPGEHPGYFGRLMHRQEMSAVTGACLLVRKDLFESVGGLNENYLGIAFNDIDLCLKVREAGYRNVWTPMAELYHHESPSRGYEDTPEKIARFAKECMYLRLRWRAASWHDPAYNPNLSLNSEDFSVRVFQNQHMRYMATRLANRAHHLGQSLLWALAPRQHKVTREAHRLRVRPQERSGLSETAWPVSNASIGYTVEKSELPVSPVHLLVFVAYVSGQQLSELQLHMIEVYIRSGYAVAVIVNARDYELFEGYLVDSRISKDVCYFAVRENFGFDFAAWSHFLETAGKLDGFASVTFTNDSVVPISVEAIRATKARVETAKADIVFLTENQEISRHGQSYFFSIGNSAIVAGALACMQNIPIRKTKEEVIVNEELSLSGRLAYNSLRIDVLYNFTKGKYSGRDLTIKQWRQLINIGFPFVKTSILKTKKIKFIYRFYNIFGIHYFKLIRKHINQRI